jgi:hypothetical protein
MTSQSFMIAVYGLKPMHWAKSDLGALQKHAETFDITKAAQRPFSAQQSSRQFSALPKLHCAFDSSITMACLEYGLCRYMSSVSQQNHRVPGGLLAAKARLLNAPGTYYGSFATCKHVRQGSTATTTCTSPSYPLPSKLLCPEHCSISTPLYYRHLFVGAS